MNTLAIFGGTPVRSQPFSNRRCMGSEEREAVLRVLDSDHLSEFVGGPGKYFNGGPEVQRFEQLWSNKYNFGHAISTNSWSTGLQVAFGAIGIEPGDEVICPPTTMSATATTALFYGGIPVFADIDPLRYTIDPCSIKEKITSRTKAIAVVHLFGYPADMDKILQLADQYSLYVVEDSAQAPGVLYKGKPVGALGDIGGFSLNYHKHIQTGEGGLIVTNNNDLAIKCQLIRNHGENCIQEYPDLSLSNHIGSNYRYTELQAAIGCAQLLKLESILEHRQRLGQYLNSRLEGITGINYQHIEPGSTHAYYMYPISYSEEALGVSRDVFVRAVMAELPKPADWETTPLASGYVKPIYLSPLYQHKIAIGSAGFPFNYHQGTAHDYQEGLCPNAEKLYKSSLIVSPLVRDPLSTNDVNDFANAIEKVIENISQLKDRHTEINHGILTPLEAINQSCSLNLDSQQHIAK